jgi:hypothetical protein
MTRTYDTGLTTPISTAVRNAFVAKLQPLALGQPKGYAYILPIGFVVEDGDTDALDLFISEVQRATPVIAVAIGTSSSAEAGNSKRNIAEFEVHVYFYSPHRGGSTLGRMIPNAAAIANDVIDPGVDASIELAWMLLQNVELHVAQVHKPRHQRNEQVEVTDAHTIWRSRFIVPYQADVNHDRNVTQLLDRIVSTLRTPKLEGGTAVVVVENQEL